MPLACPFLCMLPLRLLPGAAGLPFSKEPWHPALLKMREDEEGLCWGGGLIKWVPYCSSLCQLLRLPAGTVALNGARRPSVGHLCVSSRCLGTQRFERSAQKYLSCYRSSLRTWLAVWFPLLKARSGPYLGIVCFTWERIDLLVHLNWNMCDQGIPPLSWEQCPLRPSALWPGT